MDEEELAAQAEQQVLMGDLLGIAPVEAEKAEDNQDSLNSEFESNLEDSAPVDQAPVVDAVQESAVTEPTVEETLRAQILELTQRLGGAEVQQIYPAAQGEQAPEAQAQAQTQQVAQKQQVTATQAYLTDEELDQVIDNPTLIVTAIQRAQQDVVGQIAANLPQVISQIVNQQVMVQQAVSEFYEANQDLRQYGSFVKFVMSEMETKHKDKTFNEIFQLTADESRKRLGLKNPAAQVADRSQSSQKQKPAFAGSRRTGTSRPAGKEEFFDPAVADMLNLR